MFTLGMFGLISGFAISIFSGSKEQAIQFVPFYILILMLLSGILIPIDQMSVTLATVVQKLPLTLGASSLKTLSLDGVGFEDVVSKFLYLLMWIFGIGLISWTKFRFEASQ